MKVCFEIDPHHRKGSAVLLTNAGEEVTRIECWAQTHQGRAMALDYFERYLHHAGKPLKEGERLLFSIVELAR